MMAVRTNVRAEHLPDSLAHVRSAIEAAVPHGRTDNGGRSDVGSWQKEPPENAKAKWTTLEDGYKAVIERHPKAAHARGLGQLGTLGTGNHFIELCLDEDGALWVMLHSGSRGIGNRIGMFFIERAKTLAAEREIALADKNLAWLEDGSDDFRGYVRWLGWAQDYARANRDAMLKAVVGVLQRHFPNLALTAEAVNCHHNYASLEEHFGHRVWVTRKGAVRAGAGELGI